MRTWTCGLALLILACSTGVAHADYADVILADGPVAYWQFEETNATDPAADSSGNGLSATYVGTAAVGAQGILGNAVSFDAAGGHVALPGLWGGANTPAMSFEAWFRSTSTERTQLVMGIGCFDDPMERDAVFIEYRGDDLGMTFTAFNQDGGSGYAQISKAGVATLSDWHHLVYTIDETGTATSYVDGRFFDSRGFMTSYQYLAEAALFIGQSNLNSLPYQFVGEIDEVAIYDTALSANQVWNHYSQVGEPPVPGEGELLLSEQIDLEPFGAGDYAHYGVNLFYSDDIYSNFPTGDTVFRGVEITDVDFADPVSRAGPLTVGSLQLTNNITVTNDDDGRRQYVAMYGEDSLALTQMASGFFYVNGDHPLLEMTFSGLTPNEDVFLQIIGGDSGWSGTALVEVTGAADAVWAAADGDNTTAALLDVTGTADASGRLTVRFTVDSGLFGVSGMFLSQLDDGGTGLPGDLNNDGFVNSGDLDLVRANWGVSGSPGMAGDANDDGFVNSADLDVVRANWGNTAAAAVPEPSSLLLTFSAVLLMFRVGSRKVRRV